MHQHFINALLPRKLLCKKPENVVTKSLLRFAIGREIIVAILHVNCDVEMNICLAVILLHSFRCMKAGLKRFRVVYIASSNEATHFHLTLVTALRALIAFETSKMVYKSLNALAPDYFRKNFKGYLKLLTVS